MEKDTERRTKLILADTSTKLIPGGSISWLPIAQVDGVSNQAMVEKIWNYSVLILSLRMVSLMIEYRIKEFCRIVLAFSRVISIKITKKTTYSNSNE